MKIDHAAQNERDFFLRLAGSRNAAGLTLRELETAGDGFPRGVARKWLHENIGRLIRNGYVTCMRETVRSAGKLRDRRRYQLTELGRLQAARVLERDP